MWEIKGKDNQLKATINSLEYNGEWMGESYVTVTVESPAPVNFEIGDYIIYRDERFEINYNPGKIKSAPRYEKGDAFKYENIKFNSLADELTRCDFLDIVLNDNQLHFTGLPKFSFYGGVKDLANRMQANLDRTYGKGSWSVVVSPEFQSTKELNVQVDNIKVQGALEILVNQFETYYTISGRTITIGAAGIPAGHLFKYGKGNGLYEIEQNAEADQAIVTRVRAYGSTRNLPHRYYNSLSGADGQKLIPDNMAVQNLMLPEFPYTTQDPYIDSPNIAKLGIREGTVFFDGSGELEEIYPSIEGMTAEQLKAAGVPCNSTGALDEIVSAEQMTDNGVGEINEGETQTTAKPPTFKVTLKDLGFDINDHKTTETATISFKTGMLGGSWSDTRQPWVAGRFYWTRTKITYTDGSVAYKGEICATGEAGADAPNLLQRFSATGGAYASEWHPSYLDGDVWMQTSADGGATWSARMPVGRGGYSANLLEGTSDEWHEFALGMYAFIYAHIPLSDLGLEAGDMFTFSVDYRTGPSGKGLRVGVEAYNSEADRVLVARGNTVRDGEGRAWCSGTVPSGYAELRLRLENADAAINTMSTEEYRGLKLEKGNNPNPVWTPAAGEMVGRDGQWQKFQWAKGTDATKEPTGGWSDTPVSALPGEYVWMRSGTVVPPAAEPAKWERAVRLTGDTGAAGGDVYRLDLDNERAAVACDAAGNVTGPYPSAVASVYKGSVKLADGVAFSVAGQTGISASVSASGVLSLSAMTSDTAEVVLQAVADGVTLQSRMNLYKVRPGSSYTENLVLKSGEEVSSADYGFRVYEVSGELVEGETYTWTIWGTPGAGRCFRIYPTDWNGRIGDPAQLSEGVYSMTAKWKRNAAARKDAFMVLAAPHDATTVSTIHRIKVERGANTSPVWSPAPSEMTGEDAVTYDLQPSAGVIKRGMTGEPDVREVSCGVYKSVGASRSLTGEKTLRVWRIGEDAAESTIAHTGGQCAPVAVTARTGQVVFSLYDSDTLFDESTLLDRERVPVVSDASDLEVGGTNMLPGTKGWAGWIKHGYALAGGTYNGLGVAHLAYPAGAAAGTAYDLKMTGLVLEPDTVYTLSVWAYGTGKFISYVWPDVGGRTYSVNGVPSEATGGTIEGVNTLTAKWRRYWVVFRTRGGSLTDKSAFFRLERHGSDVWLAGAKLEKGNVPTDWSPAPGDVEAEISSFDYLKDAISNGATQFQGGLGLMQMLRLGSWNTADPDNPVMVNVMAGMNGKYVNGRTPAIWWGGDMVDRFNDDDTLKNPVPSNAASGLVRMDGSGYMSNGLIWWRANGSGGVAGSNITWNTLGSVSLGAGITIDATSEAGIQNTLGDILQFINGITKFLVPAKADGTELAWKDYKEGVQLKARMSLFSADGVAALGMGPEISGGAVGQSVELLTDWRHDPAGKALGAVLGVELRDIADHADSTAASAELKASNAGVRVTGLEGRLSRLSRRTVDRHVRRGIMPLNAEPGIIYRNQGIAKMRISKHPGRYTVDLGEYLPPSVAGAAEVHLRAGAAAVDAPPSVAVFSRSGNKVTVDILSQYAVAGYPACIMLHVSFRMDCRYLTRSGRTGYIASADGSGVLEEPLPPKPTAAEIQEILTGQGPMPAGFEVQRRRRFLGGRKPGNHGAYVYKWCLPMKGGYGIGLWRVRRRTHNHGYASGWVYAMCGRGEMKILW